MELCDNNNLTKSDSTSSETSTSGCVEKLKISDSCSNIVRKVVMLILSILIFLFTMSSFVLNQFYSNDSSELLKEVLDVLEVMARQNLGVNFTK